MTPRRLASAVRLAIIIASVSAGCGSPPKDVESVSRHLIVTVVNHAALAARIVVADDAASPDGPVGKADPAEVQAGDTRAVAITVPVGMRWSIFVNPSPDHGALIVAQDIPPDANGQLPVEIEVDEAGRASVTVNTSEPGWFGS